MANPKGPRSGAPTSGDDQDWATALDEWDSQLDDALGEALGGKPAAASPFDDATQVSLDALPGGPRIEDPAPLDEPPPLDDSFPFDSATAQEEAIPAGEQLADPLRDLFDDDLSADGDGEPGLTIEHGDEPPATTGLTIDPDPEPMADEIAAAASDARPIAVAEDASDEVNDFDDGAPGVTTRVVNRGELDPLLAGEARASVPDDDDDDLEISVELQGALEAAAQVAADVAAPPPVADDDFYDAIAIVPGKDEPSTPRAAPTPPPEPPANPDDEILTVLHRRADDPDRTPLPVADVEPGFVAALTLLPAATQGEAPPPVQQDLVAVRPTTPQGAPAPLVGDGAEPVVFVDEARRDFLGLLDTERLLADGPRVAALAFEAALLADQLGDAPGVAERTDVALSADSNHPGALWLARRAAIANGDLAVAEQLLARERGLASARERVGMLEWSAVLLDRTERHAEARAIDKEARLDGEQAGGAAFAGLAFARDRATLASARAVPTDARLSASVDVELARVDADPATAVERCRGALAVEPRNLHAALGLWRAALGARDASLELEAIEKLAEALPPSPLRAAAERRAIAAELTAGKETARERLATLADGGDDLSAILFSVDAGALAGDADLARRVRALEVLSDPGQRAAARFELGAAEEARARVSAAIALYAEAARENPADRRAERALERARSLGGDKQAELERHLRAAGTDAARAPWALVRAAALLLDLGRPDDALERIGAALDARPDSGEALELCVAAAAAADKIDDAVDRLLAGAAATQDRAHAAALTDRAIGLVGAAGEVDRAVEIARPGSSAGELAELVRRIGLGDVARAATLLADIAARADGAAAARAHLERASLVEDGDTLEDLRRTVTLSPARRSAVALATRRLRPERPVDCAQLLAGRAAALAGQPGASERALEAAIALADDGADPDAAATLLAGLSAPSPAAAAELTRLARTRGRDPGLTTSFERALEAAPAPERAAALHYAWSAALAHGGQPERAVQQLQRAHEQLPTAAIYREALERAWERAGEPARLSDLALADLREAADARQKVAAYHRLAFIDECLRGDEGSARMSYESIAELDRNDQDAARRLERALIHERRGVDLVDLYERLGLAAQDPALAVALCLERVRLRRRLAGEGLDPAELAAAIDNDLRLALFKDPRARLALREGFARAGERGDAATRGELALRLAALAAGATPSDSRAAAVYLVRAAQAALAQGRADDARTHARAALGAMEAHLPARLLSADLALRADDLSAAAEDAEQLQRLERAPVSRADAGLLAAALFELRLDDRPRAIRVLKSLLEAEPRSEVAFARLRDLLTSAEDWKELGDVLGRRLQFETDGERLIALHVELARLYRDRLGDPARARAELAAVLQQDGTAREALTLLADLEEADGRHAAAAELLVRRAKVERAPAELARLLFRLGALYARHLDDAKRAIACFGRVLQVEPAHKEAIELLGEAYAKEWDWKNALAALQRLVTLESDRRKKATLFQRAARIQEEGLKEPRHALTLYRAALELDPVHLPSVEALGQFFDRQSDIQSLRVLSDTTARRLRGGLTGEARDLPAFHSLFRVFQLRRAADRAAVAAGTIEWMGGADAEEKKALERLRTREQYAAGALADPAVDELLFDARVPASLRNLMRLVEEPLMKSFRADVKQLGLGRGDRLPRSGHPVRDVANRVAADLGVREFEVYVSPQLARNAVLELADPLSVCLGTQVVEGAQEPQLVFLFARFFKMTQVRLALALRLPAESLAALVAGIVRQFVPDFAPAAIEGAAIAAEAQRVQKALPKKLLPELHPFALECASAGADLLAICAGIEAAADRAGLVAVGAPGPALTMLERMGRADAARSLALFSVGDEIAELRRLAGSSVG